MRYAKSKAGMCKSHSMVFLSYKIVIAALRKRWKRSTCEFAVELYPVVSIFLMRQCAHRALTPLSINSFPLSDKMRTGVP